MELVSQSIAESIKKMLATCIIVPCSVVGIRPTFEPPFQIVGNFLDHDIQRCVTSCNVYLGYVRGVRSSERPTEFVGNAHELKLFTDYVELRCMYDESIPAAKLRIDNLIEVIRYWREILQQVKQTKELSIFPITRIFDFGQC